MDPKGRPLRVGPGPLVDWLVGFTWRMTGVCPVERRFASSTGEVSTEPLWSSPPAVTVAKSLFLGLRPSVWDVLCQHHTNAYSHTTYNCALYPGKDLVTTVALPPKRQSSKGLVVRRRGLLDGGLWSQCWAEAGVGRAGEAMCGSWGPLSSKQRKT